jgi:cytochrome c biogenesis protein CcdA
VSLLAAQRSALLGVAAVMLAFGIGTAIPIFVAATLSREALGRWRSNLVHAGKTGRLMLGGVALVIAVLTLTGADRSLETLLVNTSPTWLTNLTTRF